MLALIVACMAMAVAAPQALAATFGVNTTVDSSDAGGCTVATVCSLRDAVAAANAAPGSTINVRAGHYTLSNGQLAVTTATTIVGVGTRSTIIDGNGQSRVFDFEPAAPSTATDVLEIENLTVTGGSASATDTTVTEPGDGGGIFSRGGLDLEHVAVTANTAALGGAGVTDGTIDSGSTPGPATFNDVTISGNHVQGGAGNGQGGGAVVATTLTMTNSTIANNSVSNPSLNEGGGLVSAVTGGTGVTATLVNDTITGNVAAEPVSAPAGDLGGGISGDSLGGMSDTFDSVIAATNTIVAGNQADGTEANCAVIDTADGTSSHNIQGDASCGFSDSASKTTTAIALGPLQNNGGPTDTLLPAASSPAIDAGADGSACPATDERGVTRPQGAGCDIGAAELAPPTAVTGAARSITPSGATASGTASNPAVADGTATIDYGTSTAYGQSASAGTLTAGSVNAPQAAALTGLTPGTTYHYRITVTTTDGTATGADASFRTPLEPTSLKLSCSPASVKWKHSTTCAATVSDAAAGYTGTPTGSVHFKSTAKGSKFGSSGTCKLVATGISKPSRCSVSYTPTGNTGLRTITASYPGDAQHAVSAGSYRVRVLAAGCAPATGSLSGTRLGPVRLGATVAQTRKALTHYTMAGRRNMYFFCLAGGPGIRVGFLSGKAVLALTSRLHYHLGKVSAGDSLAKAQRALRIISHFRIGLNIWYIAAGGASNGVLKVRNGRVEEIGIANKKRTQTRATAFRFMSSFPKRMMS